MRFKQEARALQRRSDEQQEHIERLLRGTASNADKSEQITRLTVGTGGLCRAGTLAKITCSDVPKIPPMYTKSSDPMLVDEAGQLRSKLRAESDALQAEREMSAAVSDTWSEQAEKLRAECRALRVKAAAEEAVAGVAGVGLYTLN
jgi:hypothetical protein